MTFYCNIYELYRQRSTLIIEIAMTGEHCNYRSGSIALDWGPLRENVERAGWGREPIRWRWRPNTADRRVPRRRLTSGGRGGAPLIAASWQRRAGWERPAPQPLTHRRRLAIAIIQCYLWRSNARSFAVVASYVGVDTRATRLWCFGDFKVELVSER